MGARVISPQGITLTLMTIIKVIKHTMKPTMVHLAATNGMGSTTMVNIGLHHGEEEDDITLQDLMGEGLLGMKVWGKLLLMKGINQIVKVIKSLTVRSLQGMIPR